MTVVTLEGFVDNGQIRLTSGVQFPDGTRVYVIVPDAPVTQHAFIATPRLSHPERAQDFVMEVSDEPDSRS